ncbi:Paf1-domain-containing protein [Lindgomyces ingoldianus]|uniref:Paf1-domain-containing protein n=1 Tax=Lindgomyces ingoldianus TaxID=673940 RepID=A0ACB6R3V8_9PLEO|nr:Paf1-domain-containing protein [Lindgomyces ingoldianus]KAF2473513.1 Paf1-domain-containing protein [Lindgomyces ingoldianus]
MTSSGRPTYHQDYIARIRYSNALPPPPCPPKLLDIPNTGLSSGQYTSAGFASRLAREQSLNIEADAELGMPIDLVGLPGVFDGNESTIQPAPYPQLHPQDRALLRPPNALGKPTASSAGVSFLRRTEYITSMTTSSSRFESSNSSNTMRVRGKRRRGETSEDNPTHIIKHIIKGWNLAYPSDAYTGPETSAQLRGAEISPEEKQAWKNPKHPSKTGLHIVDSYPLVPDWDAIPDTGSFMLYKFMAPPVNDSAYDDRLDVGLLRPVGQTVEDQELYRQEYEAHKQDPTAPSPLPRYQFEFFLPPDREKVWGIKRNFTTNDPDNESTIPFDIGADEEGRPRKCFKYDHIRTYETAQQSGDPENTYNDIAIALHDPDSHEEEPLRTNKLQKAAYFYPILQKTSIRPRRPGKIEMNDEQPKVDIIETVARDPVGEVEKRDAYRERYHATEVV